MAIKIYNTINRGIRIRENGGFTGPELIADAGKPMAGGYYAGGNIMVDDKEYALIIAPKAEGQSSTTIQWKTSDTSTAGTNSTYNGRANTQAMVDAGITAHPAAQFVTGLNIGGHNDWHLPSPDELEICYRFLKPTTQDNYTGSRVLHDAITGTNPNSNPVGSGYTVADPARTAIELFKQGGSEAFEATIYWPSMEYSSSLSWYQLFNSGAQNNTGKSNSYWARAVRWVEV